MTQPQLSRRQSRWYNEILSKFDFKIVYQAGSFNLVADSLSCLAETPHRGLDYVPTCAEGDDNALDQASLKDFWESRLEDTEGVVSTVTTMDWSPGLKQSMIKFQEEDKGCAEIIRAIGEYQNYEILDDLLYVKSTELRPRRPVVAAGKYNNKDLWTLIMQHCHDTVGRQGYQKTLENVRETFYWTTMPQDIAAFVEHCDECQRIKSSTQQPWDYYAHYHFQLDLGPVLQ